MLESRSLSSTTRVPTVRQRSLRHTARKLCSRRAAVYALPDSAGPKLPGATSSSVPTPTRPSHATGYEDRRVLRSRRARRRSRGVGLLRRCTSVGRFLHETVIWPQRSCREAARPTVIRVGMQLGVQAIGLGRLQHETHAGRRRARRATQTEAQGPRDARSDQSDLHEFASSPKGPPLVRLAHACPICRVPHDGQSSWSSSVSHAE